MSEKPQETETVAKGGTAKLDEIESIVANPEKYGFEWRYTWIPARGTGKDKVYLRGETPAPLPFVVDSVKVQECFGGQILTDSFNGSSGKVESQEVVRSEIEKNRKISDTDIMRAIVRSVFFAIRRAGGGGGTRTVFVDPLTGKQYKSLDDLKAAQVPAKYKDIRGIEHDTLLASQQANIGYMTEIGMTVDMAKKALGIG